MQDLPAEAKKTEEKPQVFLPAEKVYLKVEADRLDNVINQLTDLLSKKYFFSNVVETYKKLSKIAEGFQLELQNIKTLVQSNLNLMEKFHNLDNLYSLFQKNIFDFAKGFQNNLNSFESTLRDIYDNLLDLKLTPIMSIFELYPRFVRDFAQKSGKKIRLYMRGGDTQLDKSIIEKINEPLIHLIRNACDHGIESPEERKKNGKEEAGTIIVEANKKGNRIEISIKDDGQGLNREKILAKAVLQGLVDAKKADQLEDQDVFQLIFEPNLSTKEDVSETSGRGVGMDVVKKVLQGIGGTIAIKSEKHKGTTFTLEIPIAIFTNRILFVRDENKTYALMSNLIRNIIKVERGKIKYKSDFYQVIINKEVYVLAGLSQILFNRETAFTKPFYYLIIPKNSERKIAILVEEILYEDEVIIKDCGKFLGKLKYVSGLIIAENGELITVLDMFDLVDSREFSKKFRMLHSFKAEQKERKRILVVDDSLLVREMEKNLLESNGFDVVTAINGLDGYNKAIADKFDLILADIEMPEMDGFEMIEKLRKTEEYRKKPMVVLSTRDKEEDRIRGVRAGANAWVQKQNFIETEFLKIIRNFLA